jgi:hypothetical protein
LYPWERRLVQGIDLAAIGRFIVPLYVLFILLDFFDAVTTLIALTSGPPFVELNPYAAHLFRMSFPGFLSAYLFKYVPAVPLFYMVFMKQNERYDVEARLLKFTAFVILVAADIYLGYIVLGNNVPTLFSSSRLR